MIMMLMVAMMETDGGSGCGEGGSTMAAMTVWMTRVAATTKTVKNTAMKMNGLTTKMVQ